MQAGVLYAALAYAMWGVFPIYFKALQGLPALEILVNRMVWSLVFVAIVLAVRRHWRWLSVVRDDPAQVRRFALAALVLSVNWLVFIWASNNDRVIDASLGYFINPLVNVLVGALVLHERLRPAQWASVSVAAAGVAWLTWSAGQLPWIGLVLAATFATYGFLRKTAALGSLEGLALETMLLFPLAAAWMGWLAWQGQNSFVEGDLGMKLLLAAAGPVTAVPLLLFAAGARRIPFSLLGLLQYIGPSLQLAVGIWIFREPFGAEKLVGYALIWAALALFTIEGLLRARGRAQRESEAATAAMGPDA